MLLILVPWMQISKAVMSDVAVSVTSLLGVLAAGIGLHLAFLAFNLTATAALQLGKSASNDGEQQCPCLLTVHLSQLHISCSGTATYFLDTLVLSRGHSC